MDPVADVTGRAAQRAHQPGLTAAAAVVVLAVLALWAIRLTGPPDLMHRDQERPATYVLDAVVNHHWLVQRDPYGAVASKPPLVPWISALVATVRGRVDRVALTVPGFLGVLGTALLLTLVVGRELGRDAGWLAAAAFLASAQAAKSVALVRTDGFFTFGVLAAGLLAWRAWRRGSGWTPFWLVACVVTLTKGPQGVVFALLGLVAEVPRALSGRRRTPASGLWPGLLLWLIVCGGWLVAALACAGPDVAHRMLGRELLQHVARGDAGELPLVRFWYPFVSLLQSFAPASILLPPAVWWVVRGRRHDPAADGDLVRYCAVWLLAGLVLLGLAGHQRRDLVMPFTPAAAVLVGAWLSGCLGPVARRSAAAGLLALSVVGSLWYYLLGPYPRADMVRRSAAVAGLADEVRPRLAGLPPVAFLEAPLTLQVALGTHLAPCPYHIARRLLDGEDLVTLAMAEPGRFAADGLEILAEARSGEHSWAIATNHPVADGGRWRTSWLDPLVLRWHDLAVREWRTVGVRFAPTGPEPRLEVRNTSREAAPVRVAIDGAGIVERLLEPRSGWKWPADG